MPIQSLTLCQSATEDIDQSDSDDYLKWTVRSATLYLKQSSTPIEMVAFMAMVPSGDRPIRCHLRQSVCRPDDWDWVDEFREELFEIQVERGVYFAAIPIAVIARHSGLYAIEVWEETGSSVNECSLAARYMFHVLPA